MQLLRWASWFWVIVYSSMRFSPPLQRAVLLKRYKRFLADVRLENATMLTVHCPNSGSMRGCAEPDMEVCISDSQNPNRKYRYTLEMVRPRFCWVGINTARTNDIVEEGIRSGKIPELDNLQELKREVRTSPISRLDFRLRQGAREIYVEVKHCSLVENGRAMFPDAVTERGTKHLQELMILRERGHRAVILFCVQRQDADLFTPAAHIDPRYAAVLEQAAAKGVDILAYQAAVFPQEIRILRRLPILLK
jgi:sugar fermentation stimulation protein A